MLGLWQYENWIKIILKVFVFALSVVPALLIVLVAYFLKENPVAKYLVTCLAVTVAGIGLSYWAPVLAEKCSVIKLLPGYAEEEYE